MANVTILNQRIVTEEMFGPNGWGLEPVTKKLNVPNEVISNIFPPADEKICVTGFINDKPIGHCENNTLRSFLEKLPKNLEQFKNHDNSGVKTFVELLTEVYNVETEDLLPFLESVGIESDKIAHCSGLMVMCKYTNKGIGKRLVEFSDKILIQEGYKAVVVETTNIKSQRAFEANGYKTHSVLSLEPIGINDCYSIMYKIFKN